jgi:hypothetical protein
MTGDAAWSEGYDGQEMKNVWHYAARSLETYKLAASGALGQLKSGSTHS